MKRLLSVCFVAAARLKHQQPQKDKKATQVAWRPQCGNFGTFGSKVARIVIGLEDNETRNL
jgi:hypothetical protein